MPQTLTGNFEAVVVLFHLEENGSGSGAFYKVVGVGFGGIGGVEVFDEFAGGNGSSGGGEVARASPREPVGVVGKVFGGNDVLFLIKPTLVAALTPVGHVLFGDGLALEFGGEDFFDDGEFVEPGEDFGVALTIEDAPVDLFAEVAGEAGDLAGEGVVGTVVVMVWLRGAFVRRDGWNDNFVIHPAILARN